MRPQLTDPAGLALYDRSLFVELSQHAVLIANGWKWAIIGGVEAELVWVAPPYHGGSSRVYKHRQHAYNSHMKWNHSFLYPRLG